MAVREHGNIITTIKNKPGFDATTIKIIAIVLMAADHIHQMWVPLGAPIWLKWLGRPVFPLFRCVMAESFHYTRSRKKFLWRLLLAAWFMVIFNAVLMEVLPNPNSNVVLMNGAFMTFFVAGLYMLFWDMLVDGIKTKMPGKIIGSVLLFFVPVLSGLPVLLVMGLADKIPFGFLRILLMAGMMIPSVLYSEAGAIMVPLGLLFYILRKWRWAQIAALAAVTALELALEIIMGGGASIQWMMIFAAIPILLYNGEKGRGMKYFFYIFYPAHIYLLYIIATLWQRATG
jgi:hypothetical protein